MLIQSAGYKSIDEFNAALESRIDTMEETRSAIRHLEDRQRTLSVAKESAENFIDTQDIYKQYKKSKDPKKFLRSHETEIIIHETARDQLKAMGYDEVPYPKKLEKEMTENTKDLATLNSSYFSEKTEVAKLDSVKKNIDKFMEKFTNLTNDEKKNLRYALNELSKGMYWNNVHLKDYKKWLKIYDENREGKYNPGARIERMYQTLTRIRAVRKTMTFIMHRYDEYVTDYTKLNEKSH